MVTGRPERNSTGAEAALRVLLVTSDPDVLEAAAGHRRPGDPLPATVDVLIAGSGPAG